ncbi:hypothetical protein ACNFIC_00725 [Pseudomonas sp. NY15463]|uniref:hypothetical protein n=1 Tax=Pseudomonas sp. NY15463 TaxID=3400361 RepID=UPI003A84D5FB
MKEETKRTVWAVVKAMLKSKATWRLLASLLVIAGFTLPPDLLEILRAFVADLLDAVGVEVVTALVVDPMVSLVAGL